MATGLRQFTQVGWAWWPWDSQPVVFAYPAAVAYGQGHLEFRSRPSGRNIT